MFITGNAWEGKCFAFGVFLETGIFIFYHDTFLS